MSKRKKTLQQKKIATLRKQLQSQHVSLSDQQQAQSPAFDNGYAYTIAHSVSRPVLLVPTHYVAQDLRKTVFLTLAIIAIQCILFYLLSHHIVTIPGLRY